MPKVKLNTRQKAIAAGYRSGLEERVASELKAKGVDAAYEDDLIRYIVPARCSRYTPDFVLPNGIVIETKGRFQASDRKKHVLIQDQHPDLDIRFVFSNSRTRISKQSLTSYADWCEHKGFLYADKSIPDAWLKEVPNPTAIAALAAAGIKP